MSEGCLPTLARCMAMREAKIIRSAGNKLYGSTFYGGKDGRLQYQLNKVPTRMQNLNNIHNDNLFIDELEDKQGVPPAQREESVVHSSSFDVKIKKPTYQNRKKKRFNKSLWTLQENLKYIRFLQQNQELFTSTKENRRLLKINKMISQYIGTRSPDQCRSHHQKMVKYHDSIEGIISHVYLLHSIFVEDPDRRHEKEGKVPMRIRKRINKGEVESATLQEEGEKDLWDVLCIEQEEEHSSQQNLLYF